MADFDSAQPDLVRLRALLAEAMNEADRFDAVAAAFIAAALDRLTDQEAQINRARAAQ